MTKIAVRKYSPVQPKYDSALDAYTDVVLFPKKVEMAKAIVEKYGLPPQVEKTKKSKKPMPSALQNELLTVYTFDPTEEQMQQLKAFLAQLFADKLKPSKAKQEVEMAV